MLAGFLEPSSRQSILKQSICEENVFKEQVFSKSSGNTTGDQLYFWKRLSTAGNLKFWGMGESCWILGGRGWAGKRDRAPRPTLYWTSSTQFTE